MTTKQPTAEHTMSEEELRGWVALTRSGDLSDWLAGPKCSCRSAKYRRPCQHYLAALKREASNVVS